MRYSLVEPPQPTHTGNKIEVLEFSNYECPYCFQLHQVIDTWAKQHAEEVELVFVPSLTEGRWVPASFEPMTRTFYALEALGQHKRLNDDLFNAWNVNKTPLQDEAQITSFAVKHGVDRKKFTAAYNSPAVIQKVARAKELWKIYGLKGTPSLVVDGKYRLLGMRDWTIKQLNEVMDKVRKEHGR
ncbi:MAG: thiol:disulfide interchange protein DsbA/DsbL [Pseudomonadota bacterium]